jgi:DmsE family decaheme c-type cytochrome
MLRRSDGFSAVLLVTALVLVFAAAATPATAGNPPLAARAGALAKQGATPAAEMSAAQASDYAGQDTCLTCHEDQSYKGTSHALTSNPRTPASTHGCESCHGAGKAHADAGGDKTKIVNPKNLKPQQASEVCATCHNRGSQMLWSGSQHDQRNVACITCHSVHAPKAEKLLKAKAEPDLCGTCHKNVVNKQNRFNHMPVREGKIQCSSCHNPHGSANVKLLKTGTTVNQSCTSCHTEKRGPVLWEHPPVVENCVSCHDPHGTNNDRMLVAKLPFLCQRCHVTSRHPPTPYDGFLLRTSGNSNKIYGRSCAVCHQMIHGSNAPAGKAFLR